jgi:hypothetical protein
VPAVLCAVFDGVEMAVMSEITEAASENTEKPKRGRPRVMDDTTRALYNSMYPDLTERQKQNLQYRAHAIHMLRLLEADSNPRLSWLFDREKFQHAEANQSRLDSTVYKHGILAELGRIEDEGEMLEAALYLCELKPKTKDAIVSIRRYRLGREPEGNYLTLWMALARALDDYRAVHPSTSKDMVVRALYDLAACVEDREEV